MEEQVVKQPDGQNQKKKWIILAAVMLIIASLAVFLFCINRFYLTVELSGQQNSVVEYGTAWKDPGAYTVLRGTLL